MTDQEARTLAGNLDSLPAGATSGWVWAVVVVLVIWIVYRWR
jgi:hypothetical protein